MVRLYLIVAGTIFVVGATATIHQRVDYAERFIAAQSQLLAAIDSNAPASLIEERRAVVRAAAERHAGATPFALSIPAFFLGAFCMTAANHLRRRERAQAMSVTGVDTGE